jgi:hypothetical protein
VPELGITKSNRPSQLNLFDKSNNINIKYNEDVKEFKQAFSIQTSPMGSKPNKIKVLVIGDSFGRDVANILLESSFEDSIELRYSDYWAITDDDLKILFNSADFIFFGSDYPTNEQIAKYNIDLNKVWIVGTKDFGNSNGIHYNRKIKSYSNYRTSLKAGVLEKNQKYNKDWGNKYIDLIGLIADPTGKVLVFTPEGKFISQDTLHLTKFGAIYFAQLLDSKFRRIMKLI